MTIEWARIAPVLVSISIIILVAIVRQYSKTFAAIAATMPINIPLGMWIVSSGTDNPQAALQEFVVAATINSIPLMIFLLVAWQVSKAGHSTFTTIGLGYLAWAVSLGIVFLIRGLLAR
ncbi:MAG: hypothetical protein ABI835_02515 [Chloroflexota bacterium]